MARSDYPFVVICGVMIRGIIPYALLLLALATWQATHFLLSFVAYMPVQRTLEGYILYTIEMLLFFSRSHSRDLLSFLLVCTSEVTVPNRLVTGASSLSTPPQLANCKDADFAAVGPCWQLDIYGPSS
jgi:hypothetical protein